MPNTLISNIPYPNESDGPDGPTQMQAMATALDPITAPKFASAGLRNSTITSPGTGQLADVAAVGLTRYNGSSWDTVAVQSAMAQFIFSPSGVATSTTSGTALWFNGPALTVPPWASNAYVVLAIAGIFATTAGTNNTSVQFRIGGAQGSLNRLVPDPGSPTRFTYTVNDRVTGLSGGSFGIGIYAVFGAGGTYTADTNTKVSGIITYTG